MGYSLPDGCTQRDIDEAFQTQDDTPADVLRHAREHLFRCGDIRTDQEWGGFNWALDTIREAEYEGER